MIKILFSSFLLPFFFSLLYGSGEIISQNISDFDCHGPSIVEISPDKLCAVWKGGPGKGRSNYEINENVGIWLSRCEEGIWSPPEEIVSCPHTICWIPVLCKHPSGKLYLFYRMGDNPRHVIACMKCSMDGGLNWTQEEILPAGILGPIKSKPVFDAEGKMICGSSMEMGEPEDALKATACWIEMYSDQDKTWSKYGPLEIPGKRFGAIEPTLFYDNQGNLKLLCRDRSRRIGEMGWIWTTTSYDGGCTWMPLEKISLPNPDSAIETVDLGKGRILLIYNHSHETRYPLNVALSIDGGNTWKPFLILEKESGEFPSAILSSDGLVHVTYAWTPPGKSQRVIKHIVINSTDCQVNDLML